MAEFNWAVRIHARTCASPSTSHPLGTSATAIGLLYSKRMYLRRGASSPEVGFNEVCQLGILVGLDLLADKV